MITDIHSEDRLVQATFADHLRDVLGWESIYAHNDEMGLGAIQAIEEAGKVPGKDIQIIIVDGSKAGFERKPEWLESNSRTSMSGQLAAITRCARGSIAWSWRQTI